MWTYQQHNGFIFDAAGELVAAGYSGRAIHKNVPEDQDIHNEGPIPCGRYIITAPRDTTMHGPYALGLVPNVDNEMFDRSGFLIHGDSVQFPGTASTGCIIVGRFTRKKIWESGDHTLRVVSGFEDIGEQV